MARYKIWDKVSPIYTPGADKTGKAKYTPEEWIAKNPWLEVDGAKMVVSGNKINGEFAYDYDWLVATAVKAGVVLTEGMTDEEVLVAIEAFEDARAAAASTKAAMPTAEERIAAALEYQCMLAE